MKVVQAPTLRCSPDEYAGDYLLNFYKDLGWNPKTHRLDPRFVKTTRKTYDEIRDAITERSEDAVGVGMLMINNGPSVNEDVKEGTVRLLNGWIKEDADEKV